MIGIFLDIETLGLDPFLHMPIEIAIKIVDLYTGQELSSYETLLQVSEKEWGEKDDFAVNIHQRTKDMLDTGVSRDRAGQDIQELINAEKLSRKNAFFICQNPSFDRPFFDKLIPVYQQEKFQWPYHWLDLASMFWALKLVKIQTPHSNTLSVSQDNIASSLGLNPEGKPHKAMRGVDHLIDCYRSLVGFSN